METLPEFRLIQPTTIDEAIAAMGENPDALLIAGGTDLLVNIRRGIVDARTLIELSAIEEMKSISQDEEGWNIGAGVTLSTLAKSGALAEVFPAVQQAAKSVAGPTHRAVATVGGNLCLDTRCVFYNQSEWWREANNYCLKANGDTCHVAPSGDICHAAFSGDLAAALIAFGAVACVASPNADRTNGHGSERLIPLHEMYRNDGRDHLCLKPGDILLGVSLPHPSRGLRSGYEKIRVRGAIDFPLAGVAVVLGSEGGRLSHLSIATTGTNSYPLKIGGTEDLIGMALDEDGIEALSRLLPKQIKPMPSTFFAPQYRRRAITNVTKRLAARLFDEA